LFFAVALCTAFVACSKDEPSGQSIFTNDNAETTEFDAWLKKNYADPYNIRIIYRYQDYETDQTYNVVPAKMENVKALAIMMKHIWIEAYQEVVGADFIKSYSPRIFQFIGSAEYRSDGAMVLGTAEGGLKITMFRLNSMDVNNLFIDSISPFPNAEAMPMDMNFWFFHTMHHEFLHILQQTKSYSTDFNLVSAGTYHANDWVNVEDNEAPLEGFVTGYASGEAREDMAEIYATYVTHTKLAWDSLMEAGVVYTTDLTVADWNDSVQNNYFPKISLTGKGLEEMVTVRKIQIPDTSWVRIQKHIRTTDTSGRDIIQKKLDMIKEYTRSQWGFELDDLRRVVLRRSKEVLLMDVKTLN
jgi:substrate import-associated zinc metallohydrolase lipoprotein